MKKIYKQPLTEVVKLNLKDSVMTERKRKYLWVLLLLTTALSLPSVMVSTTMSATMCGSEATTTASSRGKMNK